MTETTVDQVRAQAERLAARAWLHDDPTAYRAALDELVHAVTEAASQRGIADHDRRTRAS